METNELLRGQGWSLMRKLKLKGLFAVRSGIKSKRVRQNGNEKYSREIAEAARGITGWPLCRTCTLMRGVLNPKESAWTTKLTKPRSFCAGADQAME